MYIVQEIQSDGTNVGMLPPVIKATRNEAESEYHIKLGYAAISDIKFHSVVLYTDQGFPIMNQCYTHETPEPEPDEVDGETI